PGELRQWAHSILSEVRSIDPEIPVIGWLARTGIWLLTLPLALLSGYRHEPTDDSSSRSVRALPAVKPRSGFGASLTQLRSQIRVDAVSIVKSPVFLLVIGFGIFATFMNLSLLSSEGFGLASKPVTYKQVSVIRGSLYVYLVVCITFFSGVVVWKERDAKLDEVYDALPHQTWVSFVGKLISIMLVVLGVVVAGMFCGVLHQLVNAYTRFQIPLYLTELFVLDMPQLFCFVVLAMLVHIVSPNKYVGYFGFIILVILNRFIWAGLDVETILVRYGQLPDYTYSDMFGFAPFQSALTWVGLYWISFALLLCSVAIMLWVRGRERGFVKRIKMMVPRWTGMLRIASAGLLVLWLGCGAWAFYNTKVINQYETGDQVTELQIRYEKEHKADAEKPQPRVTKITYNIDVYPERRALSMKGDQTIVNQHDEAIDTIFIVTSDEYETTVDIEGATLKSEDQQINYRTYSIDPPMQPGEERNMKFVVSYDPKGFENEISVPQIVQNGTFFNNSIVPQIGYQSGYEIRDRDDREENGLGEPIIALPLDPENLKGRRNTYISNNSDWVEVETFISTSSDQIAIAPGSLQKQWKEDGRNHYHYKVDHPSLNFYSFISAKYEVERTAWNDIDIEVYYHKDHHWNVPKMVNSIKKSLQYYTEHFGPYKHKQARIIEFPRISNFAQAFPGTMPYSEGIGFIADIKNVDDIDMVFYVVAHEMAHQWWAHQVIGANMRGATLLSETMAQYSALMVMEHEYNRDMMRKFLKYEADNYLKNRGGEQLDERPLMEVEPTQGYVHYRKGSVVMYHLKELIGEDKVNAALRNLVEEFAYKAEPYPTSVDLIEALREQTPAEYQSVITDSFEKITLFGNRALEATWKKIDGGQYEVELTVECQKFQANSKGLETEVKLDDWIEIGAFAKPASSRKYGDTLHRELVHITEPKQTFQFTVSQKPHRAGIDPFSLLIDRDPEN
ncbi:MAG: M1 family aminopeptidase, partial [Planctomycetaceae bacterium]